MEMQWIEMWLETMGELAELCEDADSSKFAASAAFLNDPQTLDSLHWSDKLQRYADFGLHTKNVKLEKPKPIKGPDGQPRPNPNQVNLASYRYTSLTQHFHVSRVK